MAVVDYEELDGWILKPSQRRQKMTNADRMKRFKRFIATLWWAWATREGHQFHYIPMDYYEQKKYGGNIDLDDLDLDHIENVGSHPERKYDIMNVQLITREAHTVKTNAKTKEEQRKDYRPPEFIEFLESINYMG